MVSALPDPAGPAAPDLTILETRVYRGPNIWSYEPAIHLVVDLGSLEDYPTVSLPGFTDQLVELGLRQVGSHHPAQVRAQSGRTRAAATVGAVGARPERRGRDGPGQRADHAPPGDVAELGEVHRRRPSGPGRPAGVALTPVRPGCAPAGPGGRRAPSAARR